MSTITTDLGTQAAVSFREYDSTIFPTFPQCIAHATRNPLLIENLSDWREVSFEGKTMLVQEGNCLLKDSIDYFSDVLEEEDLPASEHYRPELTAKRLYDNADLWYMILLINAIYSSTRYDVARIKFVPSRELIRIAKFTERSVGNVRMSDFSVVDGMNDDEDVII